MCSITILDESKVSSTEVLFQAEIIISNLVMSYLVGTLFDRLECTFSSKKCNFPGDSKLLNCSV